MITSSVVQIFLSAIILAFDGALRPPNDPGFPTSCLGRLAACSACIILEPTDTMIYGGDYATINLDNEERILAFGGKIVDADSMTTSGEVEYEGLIFGLRKLVKTLEKYELPKSSIIKVQGDCKNVIAQMNGSARPRKLETFYSECKKIIDKEFGTYNFIFQHIPRQNNQICDAIASFVISEQQEKSLNDLLNDIEMLSQQIEQIKIGYYLTFEESVLSILRRYLSVDGKSIIPLSHRPSIYYFMNLICSSVNDFPSMLRIGEWFLIEIETEWKSASRSKDLPKVSNESIVTYTQSWKETIMEEALSYQIAALRALPIGKKEYKESDRLRKFPNAKKLNWRRIDNLVDSYPLSSADIELMNKARLEISNHHIFEKKLNQFHENSCLSKIFRTIDYNSVFRDSSEFWNLPAEIKIL